MIGHDSVFTRGRVIMSAYLRWVGFPAYEIDDLKRCRYAFFVFVGIHFWKIKVQLIKIESNNLIHKHYDLY